MKNIKKGGFLMSKIHQLSGRIISKKLKEHDIDEINHAQGRILFFLWQHDGISIQELSKSTSLEKSTLTSMLDRLEASGQIKRIPCKTDRRKILIHAQNKDCKVKDVYTQVVQQMADVYYKGFTDDETVAFEGYLSRVFENLSDYEKEI